MVSRTLPRSRAILHDVDRYLFLVLCPMVFSLQILILCIYKKYSQLMQKPKNVFFGIVVFELLINLHFFTTASNHHPTQSTTPSRTQAKKCPAPSHTSAWPTLSSPPFWKYCTSNSPCYSLFISFTSSGSPSRPVNHHLCRCEGLELHVCHHHPRRHARGARLLAL